MSKEGKKKKGKMDYALVGTDCINIFMKSIIFGLYARDGI